MSNPVARRCVADVGAQPHLSVCWRGRTRIASGTRAGLNNQPAGRFDRASRDFEFVGPGIRRSDADVAGGIFNDKSPETAALPNLKVAW